MAKQYKVIVQSGASEKNTTFNIVTGAGVAGQPLKIKAEANTKYQLADIEENSAPKKIKVKRVNQNLEISFTADDKADLVLDDYFTLNSSSEVNGGLYGKAEDGSLYEYISEETGTKEVLYSLKEGASPMSQALGGPPVADTFTLSSLPIVAATVSPWAVVGGTAAFVKKAATFDEDVKHNPAADLTGEQVAALSTSAFAALTIADLKVLSASAVHGITVDQIATLDADEIRALGTNISALSDEAMASFSEAQAAALTSAQVLAMTSSQIAALCPSAIGSLTFEAISSLSPAQVAKLSPAQISALNPEAITGLTSASVASLSSEQLASLSPEQVAKFSPEQLDKLTTAQVGTLTLSPSQIGTLSPAQLAPLNPSQLDQLSPSEVSFLTPNTIASLTPTSVTSLSNDQLGALTPAQVAMLSTVQLDVLTKDQVAALSPEAVAQMTPDALASLSNDQLGGLTAAQVAKLSSSQLDQLTAAQVAALSPDAVTGLTPTQMSSLDDAQLAILGPAQIAALSPSQLSELTPSQVALLNPVVAITSNATALKAGEAATITFTFSEDPLATFDATDIVVAGGTLGPISGTGLIRTATFTPATSSTTPASISVASGKFADAAGNLNTDGSDTNNTIGMSVDTISPTVAITSNATALKAGEAATITFTFSEDPLATFDATDIVVTGGTLGPITGTGLIRTATFTPKASSRRPASISVASGKFADAAGNLNTDGLDTNNTVEMTVDTFVPDALVNTTTAGAQTVPKTALLSDGGYITTWTSDSQDGNLTGIYAQKFSALGVRMGSEFLVNTSTTGQQQNSSAVGLSNGDYLITWSGSATSTDHDIYGQRFTSAGVKVGTEVVINTTTAGAQTVPVVTALTGGQYVVAWDSSEGDGSGSSVYARLFGANGVAIGNDFVLSTTTAGNQNLPAIAALTTGGFVATYQSPDVNGEGIFAKRFDALGVAVGSEFMVNALQGSGQLLPSVTGLEGGGFAIAFASWGGYGGGIGWDNELLVNTYDFSGTALGSVSMGRVGAVGAANTATSAVTALTGGDYLVVWDVLTDASGSGIYGQRFTSAGVTSGSKFLVNTFTTGEQRFPAVSSLADGGYVVSWQSDAQDGSSTGIYQKRYNAEGVAQLALGEVPVFMSIVELSDVAVGPADAGRSHVLFGSTKGAFAQNTVDQLGSSGDNNLNGNNTLTLTLKDVLDMSGMNLINSSTKAALGWTGGTYAFGSTENRHQLIIDGKAGDVVNSTGGFMDTSQTAVMNSHTYEVYNSTNGMAQLLIDLTVTRTSVL